MKRFLIAPLACLTLLFALASSASTQGLVEGYPGGYPGDFIASSYSGAVSYNGLPFLGPVDLSVQGAKQGFGYEGAYFSGQTLIPVYSDGRAWYVADIRASLSENGGMFTNLGMLRRTHFRPLNADFGLGIYWDHDADKYENFGHSFDQVGVHAHMYTWLLDIEANGYIPVGETTHFLGRDGTCFVDNRIVFGGVDAALEGFDVSGTIRPPSMIPINGELTLGGYAYRQDGITPFGGFLGAFAFQPRPGVTVRTGVQTSDSEFGTVDTAGFIQVALNLGGSRGYSPTGRDLDPPRRKAHIVRAHSDPEVLRDASGAEYVVLHVDNTTPSPMATGTVDDPFDDIADAIAMSMGNEIIFVNTGTQDYTAAVNLLEGQLLLGDGVEHPIPTFGGGTFILCNNTNGPRPTITGAITNNASNTIRGFILNPGGGQTAINIANQGMNGSTIIDQVDIVSGFRGIAITGANTGTVDITSTSISNTTTALEITGGTANNLDVSFDGTITAGAGATAAVRVNDFVGNTVGVMGTIQVDPGATRGLELLRNDGNVSISANTTIDSTTQQGILIEDTVASGVVSVANAALTNANTGGGFSVEIDGNNINGSTVNLTSVTIENTTAGIEGLSIVDSDNVNLQGNNSIETSEAQLLFVDNSGNFAGGTNVVLNFSDLTSNANGNGDDAIDITDTTGSLTVSGTTLLDDVGGKGLDVDNTNATGAFAINIDSFETTNTGDDAIELTNFQDGSTVVFDDVNIQTANGIGLESVMAMNSDVSITINDGDIDATGGAALDITNTEVDITLDNANSNGTGASPAGIRIDNDGIVSNTGVGANNTVEIDNITIAGLVANDDGVFIQDFLGDFTINGGTINDVQGANASGIQIDNDGPIDADFTINNVAVDFVADAETGIEVAAGDGNIQISNNNVTLNMNTGTAYQLESRSTTMGFNLGNNSLNNVTDTDMDPGITFNGINNAQINNQMQIDDGSGPALFP